MNTQLHRRQRRALVTALLLAPATHIAVAQSVLLQPRYVGGRTSYVEEQMSMWLELTGGPVGAGGIEVYSSLTMGTLQTVESATSESVRLKVTIDRVAVKMKMPLIQPMGWDTDGVDPTHGTPALGKVLSKILGKSYLIELDADHQVTSIEGLSAIRKPLEPFEESLPALTPVLLTLREDHVKKEWGAGKLVLYPMRRVMVGDTWTRQVVDDFGASGEMLTTYKCTLVEIKSERGRRMALVDVQGAFEQKAGGQSANSLMGMGLRFRAGGLTGSAKYDVLRDQYVGNDSKAWVTLDATLPNNEQELGPAVARVRVEQRGLAASLGERNRHKRKHRAEARD